MKVLNNYLDKSAVTLSLLCVVHCLALPLITVLVPSIIANALNQELFHLMMVVCVLPVSIYALTMGCRNHNKFSIGVYGALGLITLVSAFVFGESHLGEMGEKGLTTLGAIIIAFAHIKNYQLCNKTNNCAC
ncbi:MerC domain-containing protein [Colwellia sp. 1_MG-2023]|uniref:MerC domain-containing protein n=1 Tax=Colwellia sp. 1_MG-2023 TaxID=3062649 RepID=UPI0026E45807|nr:MerC domain-containing protein [Colwellia sp. 1_MG-2023]MDO6446621.1 MerC domain-containing protein [Colwellia sp. 1_MG-2023]